MSNRIAYKILVISKNGNMRSPISFAGLVVKYRMNCWAKPKNSTRYLFVYKTLKDAKKVFALFNRAEQRHLIIVECTTENFRKAVGAGLVCEYRCTKLKPIRVIE